MLKIQPDFGHKPIYTLKKPLKVKKGQVAALTTPTYAPIYTNKVSSASNSWKASRAPDKCGESDVANAKPHLRKGSTRTYGCNLTGERILYYAYFVKTKKSGGGGKGGHSGGGGGGKTDPNRVVTIGPAGGPDAAGITGDTTGGVTP